MAEKESFVFYKSFYDALQDLKEKDRLKVYDAICELALNGNETKLSGLAKTMFTLIKPQLLANTKRYEDGKKGGRPRKKTSGFEQEETIGFEEKKTSGFQKKETSGFEQEKTIGFQKGETSGLFKKKPNVNENVNENENVNVNENENVNVNVNENENVNVNVNENAQVFCDADVVKINQLMIECLNTTNTNNVLECVNYLNKLSVDVIEYALKKTSRIANPNWGYAMAILDSYIAKKIVTVELAKADDLKHRSKNNKTQDNFEQREYNSSELNHLIANFEEEDVNERT